jgi:GTPase
MNQQLPMVALLGRPNVGKSTLFNRLIKRRVSITHDMAGVTRDSIFSEVRGETRTYMLIDTGGLVPDSSDEIEISIFEQAREAMAGADLILFIVDGRTGLHPQDEQVGQYLRQSGKEVRVLVNKVDGPRTGRDPGGGFLRPGFSPSLCVRGPRLRDG